MPEACPRCGGALPGEGWEGLCPSCLVRVSVEIPEAAAELQALPSPLTPLLSDGSGESFRKFGDYELLEEIARGGMGVVFKARQISLNRIVAVKMILAGQLAGEKEVQRFRAEAESAARLQHPHIVAIHEVGQHDGQHFFSMDYVEGQNLAEFVHNQPLPAKQAAKLLKPIAEAIHYAHQQGILHRDLKPSNILIDSAGQPRVTDFGLAKQMKGDSDLTISGQVIGSPNFMPPEQAVGKRSLIGPHSDVYALGAILFYLLTARPPFAAESMTETLQQVVTNDPPSPRLLNPGVLRDLETICLKCLAKEPTHRYRTTQELADELGRVLQDEPILARPAGPTEKAWRWCRRKPALASALVVVLVLLLVLGIGSPIAAFRINRARQLAQSNATESRTRLVRQYVANGNRLVDEGDFLGALPWFAKALKEEQADPSRAQIHRLRLGTTLLQCPRLVQAWFHKEVVNDAAFSPDGRWVLIRLENGEARVWDATSGEPVSPGMRQVNTAVFSPDGQRMLIVGDGTGVWDIQTGRLMLPLFGRGGTARWSPDGRRILLVDASRSQLFDANTGKQIGDAMEHYGAFWAAFSPDGMRIVTVANEGTARVWDGVTGAPVTDPVPYAFYGLSPDFFGGSWAQRAAEFSPDGRQFALACANSTARVCDAASGRDIAVVHHDGIVRRACFSPDGRRLATASHDSTARVWDVASGNAISPPLRHLGPVMDISFSPDGKLVVTASADGTARIWDSASGRQVAPALQHAAMVAFAAFSPDGERVLTAGNDQGVRVWEWRGAGAAYFSAKHPVVVQDAAFSPDGHLALTASLDGTVHVWDVRTGQFAKALEEKLVSVRKAQFSADGRLLAVADTNGCARVWDCVTSQPVSPVLNHTGLINHVEFSPDGKWLVAAGSDRMARVWEVASGRLISEMQHRESVNYATFTPDGKEIVTVLLSVPESFQLGDNRTFDPVERQAITANWSQAQFWNAETGQPVNAPVRLGSFVSHISFSPDRLRVLATCSARGLTDQEAWVVDLRTGQRVGRPFEHDKGLVHGSLSPDGKLAVTASWDHTARVWDAATGQPIGPRLEHRTYVYYAMFSQDSRLVATASADHTARVWDAATGEPVTPPLKHSAAVNRVVFGPDDRFLLTLSSDGEARVWRLPKADLAVDQEVQLAQLLAAHRIDATDAALPLTADMMGNAWTAFHKEGTLEPRDELALAPVWKSSQAGLEEDYHVPGEDTGAGMWDPAYQKPMDAIASQVRPDLPFPLSIDSAGSNQLVRFVAECSRVIDAQPNPQHGGFYKHRAHVYERLGQYRQAIQDMREWLWRIGPVLNRNMLVEEAYLTLGRSYWLLGETENAETYLQIAEDRARDDAVFCDFLAKSYAYGPAKFRSVEKALPFALKAVALSNTNLAYAGTLSDLYSRLGQPQKAEDILERAIELHPNSAQVALFCNNLAWNYATGPQELWSLDRALPLALKAVQLAGTRQNEMNTLGVVYYRLGQLTNAVTVFERNTQKESGQVTACDRLFLAMSYQRLGDSAKAESAFGKAAEWLDQHPDQEDLEMKAFRAEAEELLGRRTRSKDAPQPP